MTDSASHYSRLIHLFDTAPIQQQFLSQQMHLSTGICTIEYTVDPHFFHGGSSMHGAVYFKLLDDAAYFAAATLEVERFLLTASMEVRLLKIVTGGVLTSKGHCSSAEGRIILAASALHDASGTIVATAEGKFQRSSMPWSTLPGYSI